MKAPACETCGGKMRLAWTATDYATGKRSRSYICDAADEALKQALDVARAEVLAAHDDQHLRIVREVANG